MWQKLEGHRGGVIAVAQLSSGQIVTGSTDDTIRIWELSTEDGEEKWVTASCLPGHADDVTCLAVVKRRNGEVEKGDYIVSGSMDKTVRFWKTGPNGAFFGKSGKLHSMHTAGVK